MHQSYCESQTLQSGFVEHSSSILIALTHHPRLDHISWSTEDGGYYTCTATERDRAGGREGGREEVGGSERWREGGSEGGRRREREVYRR